MRRAILLNGINAPTERGDAQDRTLPVELDRIPDNVRRGEEELWAEFEADHPRILGAVFSALSKVIHASETVRLSKRPRLADWGYYAAAAYEVFGWGGETFLKDWSEVVRIQNQGTLDGSPAAQAILAFMEDRDEWEGYSSELHKLLEDKAEDLSINTRDKAWPKSAGWLWKRIKEVIPLLTAAGVEAIHGGNGKAGTVIYLKRSGAGGGPGGGSSPDGGSKNGSTTTFTTTEDSAEESRSGNGGSSGSKYGPHTTFYPKGKKEAQEGAGGVDNAENGGENTPPPESPKSTTSTTSEGESCPHPEPGVCWWCKDRRESGASSVCPHGSNRLTCIECEMDRAGL